MILVDIEMPKNCTYCPMSHWDKLDRFTGCDAVCGKRFIPLNNREFWGSNGRPDWCPIKADVTDIIKRAYEETIKSQRYDKNPDIKVFKDE